jgi:hypothetical protein
VFWFAWWRALTISQSRAEKLSCFKERAAIRWHVWPFAEIMRLAKSRKCSMPQFIRRTMNWGELPGEPLLSFDLNIALVPDEPDTDTTERFRLEAVRIARAFLLEQDVEKPGGSKGEKRR